MSRWTEAEDALLREHYGARPATEILDLFPGRAIQGIRRRANLMGLRGWVSHEHPRPSTPSLPPCSVPAQSVPKPTVTMASISGRGAEALRAAEGFLRNDGYQVNRARNHALGTNAVYQLVLPDDVAALYVSETELIERAKRREAAILRTRSAA